MEPAEGSSRLRAEARPPSPARRRLSGPPPVSVERSADSIEQLTETMESHIRTGSQLGHAMAFLRLHFHQDWQPEHKTVAGVVRAAKKTMRQRPEYIAGGLRDLGNAREFGEANAVVDRLLQKNGVSYVREPDEAPTEFFHEVADALIEEGSSEKTPPGSPSRSRPTSPRTPTSPPTKLQRLLSVLTPKRTATLPTANRTTP